MMMISIVQLILQPAGRINEPTYVYGDHAGAAAV